MTNVWPCGTHFLYLILKFPCFFWGFCVTKYVKLIRVGDDDGIDRATARRDFAVGNGDLLVMRGDTQKHWHHRVPKARSRRPRININFRYILPGSADAERGQQTYYKYLLWRIHVPPNRSIYRC